MRILHIGPDSPFVQFAARAFESVAPGANEYLILSQTPDQGIKYPIAAGTVHVIVPSLREVLAMLVRRFDCDLIVAHSMTAHAAAAFARAGRSTTTVWSGWGYDYYGTEAGDTTELLGPLTRQLVERLGKAESTKSRTLRRSASAVWNAFARGLVRGAAGRSNYFSAPVPTDEPVFRARYPQFHGQYHQLNYASAEETFATTRADHSTRGGILIGNSATPSNNHLEAFELLAGRALGNRQVVVPLSYGDPRYRDVIVERGGQLFGDAFTPLIERMPLDDYNAIVADCDVVIMNQRRQQALGNIGTALYAGASVYLDDANPVYRFLRDGGASVKSISELRSKDAFDPPASATVSTVNRPMLRSFWGQERVHHNVEELLRSAAAHS